MATEVRLELESGAVVCERCLIADKPWSRLRGLLGRSDLPAGQGILLRPSSSVHMMFMRFAIVVVFCDGDLRVLSVVAGLRPWRFAAKRGAKVTVELAAGEAESRGLAEGAQLRIAEA
jgi:uncharacterized membrane protein (UPF0127 family)